MLKLFFSHYQNPFCAAGYNLIITGKYRWVRQWASKVLSDDAYDLLFA